MEGDATTAIITRPQFVLFGSSIVQFSYGWNGYGASLHHLYSRKADILLRGYAGWTSDDAVKVHEQVFPKNTSLAIIYFGGNDSVHPPTEETPRVPIPRYKNNMKRIVKYLQLLNNEIRIILLSVPPVNEDRIPEGTGRTLKGCEEYSEACLEVSREMKVTGIDLFNAIQRKEDWLTTCFLEDGIHLSAEGSKIVGNEILKAIEEADWRPSLYWRSMPNEFAGISAYDPASNGEISLDQYYDGLLQGANL